MSESTVNAVNRNPLYLYERQERFADRLNKKIDHLDQRLTALEERGRS